LTLIVALTGAAVMLATSRTRNPAFMFCTTDAHGWPFPWRMDYCPCGGGKVQHRADYWLYNFGILLGTSLLIGRCARGWSAAKPTLTLLAMLTIAPVVAVATLLCCTPTGRSDLLYPIAVASYVFRGIAINWATYIPALIIVPVLMTWISARRSFRRFSLQLLLTLSVSAGAAGGMCVALPMVLEALDQGGGWVLPVLFAGAASGAITLTLICLIYRRLDSRAELGASPNGGPAMPLGNSGVMEGPPSVS
jgi:hypothetical protein